MSRTRPPSPATPDDWVARETAWVDARLRALGRTRTGPLDVGRSRPWGRVSQVPTDAGPVWLKVPARELWFELDLVARLATLDPPLVPPPLAVDRDHGRLLLADQGRSLAEVVDEAEVPAAFAAALVEMGRLQRASAALVPDLLAAGVADVRPAAVTARLDDLVRTGRVPAGSAAIGPRLAAVCAELARSAVPAAVDHNDLHDGNVMLDAAGRVTILDWGDSVVAHPFAVLLVAQRVLVSLLGDVPADHPAVVAARRDYLAVFAPDAPGEDLERTARLAVAVAYVGRAWTWQRALATFVTAGETPPPDWADAPREWLALAADALAAEVPDA